MIWLQVYSRSLGVFPFERDTPRSVYVKRIALRFAVQRMKVKSGLAQTVRGASRFQSIEPDECPAMQGGAHASGFPGLEKLLEAAMFKASDHMAKRKVRLYKCKVRPNSGPRLDPSALIQS